MIAHFDARSGKQIETKEFHQTPVLASTSSLRGDPEELAWAWRPDGKQYALGTANEVITWDATTNAEVFRLKNRALPNAWNLSQLEIRNLSWSPDGQRVTLFVDGIEGGATLHGHQSVWVADQSKEPVTEFSGAVANWVPSPDLKWLFTGAGICKLPDPDRD